MHSVYTVIQVTAICLAVVAVSLLVVAKVFSTFPHWFSRQRLPLQVVHGVITSADKVFVADGYAGRVYKFDFNGDLLRWLDWPGRPIWIRSAGASIIVHYSGRDTPLEDPAFKIWDPHGVTASMERTWCGHPVLVVRRPDGTTTRRSLQPWYLTVVQSPYPADLWFLVFMASCLVGVWAARRRRLNRAEKGKGAGAV